MAGAVEAFGEELELRFVEGAEPFGHVRGDEEESRVQDGTGSRDIAR